MSERASQAGSGSASSRLAAAIERYWSARLDDDPLFATSVGAIDDGRRNASLPVVEPERLARNAERDRLLLGELRAIELAGLEPSERASHAVLEGLLVDALADYDFGAWQMPLNSDSGFHIEFAWLADQAPLRAAEDYEAYIARLAGWPAHVEARIANLRLGIESGRTVPRVSLAGYEVTIASHIVDEPEQSLFWAPFTSFPSTLGAADRERLTRAGRQAIREGLVAGYADLLAFFVDEYYPAARTSISASELPRGRAYYEHLVRSFTTLDLTPREVHDTGLAEVARLRAEMQALIESTQFEGDFAAFLEFLRTEARFYARTPEELLARAARICKQVDAALPAFFGHLPRLPYGVAPVPAHLAPKYTGGRYVPASPGSSEPGWYWVNTHALESRPLYILEALTLHEAVPGHHLQVALGQEHADLPEFRRHVYHPAYGEGWALYAEHLGLEMGFYGDPYTDFGRLSYEMWRACRLVVDPGLHAFGWTRERAIEYLASNTALSLHEVGTEIDRYISWPGQALSYKIGELEIRRLRAAAEAELGPSFDLRAFHDAILATGSVPLSTLRAEIERFIAGAARPATESRIVRAR